MLPNGNHFPKREPCQQSLSPKPHTRARHSFQTHFTHPSRPTLTPRHSFEIHATMADPSASVSPQLLHHLHALCVMKYPLYQSLQPELLVDMLLKTPVVVQQYPFAWSMIEPPPPGSLMLSWHPPAMGTSCASDGYVWADPENVHTVDVKGYVCLPRPAVLYYRMFLSSCYVLCFHPLTLYDIGGAHLASFSSRLPITIRDNISEFPPPPPPTLYADYIQQGSRPIKKFNLSLRISLYLPFILHFSFLFCGSIPTTIAHNYTTRRTVC